MENQYNFIFLYLCSEMVADVAITATMLFKLLHSQTGWQTTDKKITRVSRWALSVAPPVVCAYTLQDHCRNTAPSDCIVRLLPLMLARQLRSPVQQYFSHLWH